MADVQKFKVSINGKSARYLLYFCGSKISANIKLMILTLVMMRNYLVVLNYFVIMGKEFEIKSVKITKFKCYNAICFIFTFIA